MPRPPAPPLSRRRLLLVACAASAAGCSRAPGADAGDAADGDAPGDADAFDPREFEIDPRDAGAWDAGDCAVGESAEVHVGAVSDFAIGRWYTLRGYRIAIARDARGLYAYSLLCPHFAGFVVVDGRTGAGFCLERPLWLHDAQFDGTSAVTKQPGSSPRIEALRNLAVRLCDGHVFVDPAASVPYGTRVPA